MTADTAARHAAVPFPAPWAGVTDADQPVIGWSILPAIPALAYLADAGASRPADEQETAARPYLYAAYEPWKTVAGLAADGIALAAKILAAPVAQSVRPVPAVRVIPEPDPGSVAELTAERISEDARAALARWSGTGQGQPAAKPEPGSPEALAACQEASNELYYAEQNAAARAQETQVIPVTDAETTITPAITAGTEGKTP